MPKLGNYHTERLVLPSTAGTADEVWLEVRDKIDLGILADAYQFENQIDQTLLVLSRIIVDWNFTEDGTPDTPKVPITVDSVRKLETSDFTFLTKWVDDHVEKQAEGMSNEEKKASSATSPVAAKIPIAVSQSTTSNTEM